MLKLSILAVVALTACGGKQKQQPGDDCQKFVERSTPVLRKMGAAEGRQITQADLDKLGTMCRSPESKGKDETMYRCVLAAADEAAVSTCWEAALKDYASAGRKSEADLMLNRLAKDAKIYAMDHGAFPVGKVELSADCCAKPGKVCPAAEATWPGPYQELEFTIEDDFRFRYAIDSTATRLEARAVGDTDCDGKVVELKLVVTLDGTGFPQSEVTTSGAD